MKADKCPTDPLTTMSMPFMEISAARGGIAINHQEAAATARTGSLRCVAFNANLAGHHIFCNALPRIAVNDHASAFVHAGTVVTDVASHLDQNRRINTRRDRMLTARIEDAPMRFIRSGRQFVKCGVEFTQRRVRQIDCRHQCRSHKYGLAGSGSHTLAVSIPGRSTKARYSVPKATHRSVSAITAGLQAIGSRSTPNPELGPNNKGIKPVERV